MLLVTESLHKRQIEALRRASGITTFKIFLDMNDFMLDLATKAGGRTDGGASWLGSFMARNKITGSPEKETAAS